METANDHVYLFVNCMPQQAIPSMKKAIKGVYARKMFQQRLERKEKLWGGCLGWPGYFVATISENTDTQIKEYLQNQQINWK